jgi:hypothetical protein
MQVSSLKAEVTHVVSRREHDPVSTAASFSTHDQQNYGNKYAQHHN